MAVLRLLYDDAPPVESPYPGIDGVLETSLYFIAEATADARIQALAARIVEGVGNYPASANLIADTVYRWMAQNITYQTDPSGVEEIQTAIFTLNMDTRTGDCEDMVIFAASLLAWYMPVRLYVVRQGGFSDWNHILLQYHDGRSWQNFDPTLAQTGGYAGQTIAEDTIVERRFLPVPSPRLDRFPTPSRPRGRLMRIARFTGGLSGVSSSPNASRPGAGGADLYVLPYNVVAGRLRVEVEVVRRYGAFYKFPPDIFCPDAWVAARTAQGVVASVRIITNNTNLKFSFRSIGERCRGRGVLVFPATFDLKTPVTLEVHDGDLKQEQLASRRPIVATEPIRFAEDRSIIVREVQEPEPPIGGPLAPILRAFEDTAKLGKWAVVAVIVGSLAYIANPLIRTLSSR